MTGKEFESTHKLDFLSREWGHGWMDARIGTCGVQWRATEISYEILTIVNNEMGNGHLQDVFDWFENSCKRDNKTLVIREVWNERFKKHLIEKRGFKDIGGDMLEKVFR